MLENRPFRILHVDLSTGKAEPSNFQSAQECFGGSGLAAALFRAYGDPVQPAHEPSQPLIFAIGPLTGYFPLMSKVVCGFKSPYTGEYAESHAGGRLALAMRFAGYDALVVTGKAEGLSCLIAEGRRIAVENVHYLKGYDVFATGKALRHMQRAKSGHRSIIRIGRAGENLVPYACINVDTYRHFGRLGAGAVMGGKNLKAIMVGGELDQPIPEGKDYPELLKDVHHDLTGTDMMKKYHDLGTPGNLILLNEISAMPWKNLQMTKHPEAEGISGERFAEQLLLRQTACSGCPVGCIHIGLLREKFAADNEYLFRQVSYDHEPIFACGAMLELTSAGDTLSVIDECEREGLDVMSAGVALSWAAEAFEKGIISETETVEPLAFGDAKGFRAAVRRIGGRENDFFRTLGDGAAAASKAYGGEDFACVLGQEMAGYATGEAFFVSQALGFRHSHLDSGGYSLDQSDKEKDSIAVAEELIDDEKKRVGLTCMVSCLFARKIYSEERLVSALNVLGFTEAAKNFDELSAKVQAERWKLKFACGYKPQDITIPKRFREVVTWKGPIDETYLDELKVMYQNAILRLAT